jgi:hypothetical protein
MPVLFHYTDAAALQAILSTEQLLPSTGAHSPNDVRYCDGQYLTDIEPGTMTGAQLSRRLLGHPFQGRRFTHYLALDIARLKVVEGRPNVWIIPNTMPLDIGGRVVRSGSN